MRLRDSAAPACHNFPPSPSPALPACEKRDLSTRNPFSWVRPFPPSKLHQSNNNFSIFNNNNNNNNNNIHSHTLPHHSPLHINTIVFLPIQIPLPPNKKTRPLYLSTEAIQVAFFKQSALAPKSRSFRVYPFQHEHPLLT